MTQEKASRDGWVSSLLRARPVLGCRHHLWLVAFAVVGYGLDVLTKQLALNHLVPGQPFEFLGGWFTVQLLFNPGAAFSLGEGFTIAFAMLSLVALVILLVLVGPRVRGPLENIVAGLLMAGVAGNLTDRIVRPPAPFHGYVVDFLGIKYFAVFNVADMCITAAAVTIVIALLRAQAQPPVPPA